MKDIFEDMDKDIQSIIDPIDDDTQFKLTNPIAPQQNQKTNLVPVTDEKSFDMDFDYIRKNLKSLINTGTESLEQLILVAQASEHPRAFEVVAKLIDTLAKANKDLLSAHESRDGRNVVQNNTTNVQTNTVFVGSTADFSKMIKKRKEKVINDE